MVDGRGGNEREGGGGVNERGVRGMVHDGRGGGREGFE
jgi:hypothetical protein